MNCSWYSRRRRCCKMCSMEALKLMNSSQPSSMLLKQALSISAFTANLYKSPITGIVHNFCYSHNVGEESLSAKHQTCRQEVVSLSPDSNGRRIVFSGVNFLCWLVFSDHFNIVLLQWHVKDPGHPAKTAGGRLHLNKCVYIPWTQLWSGLTILSRHSVGTH